MGLETIGIIGSIAGTAMSAIGSIQQGNASKASADYNAQVAQNNAKIAQDNASRAAVAGDEQAATQQQKTRATVGALKAAQAASGIDVNTGSAVDVRSSAAELGELDAITIRSNAARQAYGYQVDASNATAQSQLDKFQGQNAQTAGYMGAAGDLLGGIGSATTKYANFQSKNSPIDMTGNGSGVYSTYDNAATQNINWNS